MQRTKTLKLSLIAALSIMPLGWANAACPDITGQWAVTYDEVFAGDTAAGVGNMILTNDTTSYWGAETFRGINTYLYITGRHSVDPYCNLVWNYVAEDGSQGIVNGVIVNVDKIIFIFTNTMAGRSGRAIAERLKQN